MKYNFPEYALDFHSLWCALCCCADSPSCTGSRHGCCGGALHLLHDEICAPDEKGILRKKREMNGAGKIGQRLRWQYCCVSDRYGLSR